MNKTTTILLALLIGLCSFSLAKKPPEQLINSPINNKIQFLQAGTYRQVPMNIVRERIKARVRGTDNDLVPLDKVNRSQNSHGSVRDDLWDLTHVDDYAEWYRGSGDAEAEATGDRTAPRRLRRIHVAADHRIQSLALSVG